MIPASSSRGARLVGVSPVDDELHLGVVLRGGVGQAAEVLADEVDTKPSWSAEGCPRPRHDDRAQERPCDGRHDHQHQGRDDHEEQEEAQDPADAAAAVAVLLVTALVPGPRPYRPVRGRVGPSDGVWGGSMGCLGP
jgi:hypothetical protein